MEKSRGPAVSSILSPHEKNFQDEKFSYQVIRVIQGYKKHTILIVKNDEANLSHKKPEIQVHAFLRKYYYPRPFF